MKKTTLLMALAISIISFSTGCAKTGTEISASTVIPAEQNRVISDAESVEDNVNQDNNGFATDFYVDAGVQTNTDNSVSWGGGADENSINPMLKYFGENGQFPPSPYDNVDVDFTVFSGSEFDDEYSQIMFWRPEDYYGKSMRLIGPYIGWPDEESGNYYHFLLVDDAAGCCFRYVQFSLDEDHNPSEYPEDYTIVDITGVFGTYYDESIDWDVQHLVVDEMFVLENAHYITPDWSES